MEAWQRVKLGDLIETQKGYAFKSDWYSREGRPIVKVSDFTSDSIDSSKLICIPEHIASDYLKYALKVGDVIVQTVGSWPNNPASVVGKCVGVPSNAAGALLNQNAVRIAPSSGLNAKFLYYLLRCDDFKNYIINTAQGAASQAAITLKAIRNYEFAVPPLPLQCSIAEILSAYDELIVNSQDRFGILETTARALYCEVLRDPESAVSIRSILECEFWSFMSTSVAPYTGTKRYYATADIDGLTFTGPGIDYTYHEKPSRAQRQPQPDSVWFARMNQTYKIAWFTAINAEFAAKSILSSGFAGFQASDRSFFALLFLTLTSREFHAQKDLFCTGATQMSLTNEGLARIAVPIPTDRAARRMGQWASPLLDQMLTLQLRIQNLRLTRDLLLPALLSGQVGPRRG